MTRLLRVPLVALALLLLLNGCSYQSGPSSTNRTENIVNNNLSVGQFKNINAPEISQKGQMTKKESPPQRVETPPEEVQASTPELSAFPAEGIPVLMYHSISYIPGNNLGVPVTQFAEEIEWLKSHNYSTLSLEDFYQALVHQKSVPQKPILITFDDGYIDNYQAAWPILRENDFRATFFIITSSVGSGMMSWEQIHELADQGNSIASHTVTHPDLSTLSSKQLETELAQSKKDLESNIGKSVDALCFPSGSYNDKTLEIMLHLGYKLGFTTKSGKVHLGDNPLTLKRIRIPGGMSLTAFKNLFP